VTNKMRQQGRTDIKKTWLFYLRYCELY